MERKISTVKSVISEQSNSQAQMARALTEIATNKSSGVNYDEVMKFLEDFRKEQQSSSKGLQESIQELRWDIDKNVKPTIDSIDSSSKSALCFSMMTLALLTCHVQRKLPSKDVIKEELENLGTSLSSMPGIQQDIVDFCVNHFCANQMELMSFPSSELEKQSTQAKPSPETPGESGKGPAKK